MLQVCETFISIQGESTYVGCPCYFIRLSGCNLRCSYCDTAYAYDEGRICAMSELVDEFRASGVSLVSVTGGEPLIQLQAIDLLNALLGYGTVLLDTNGSQDISVVPSEVIIIMDIKCPGSGESDSINWRNIQKLRPVDEVKFVIRDRDDYLWAKKVVMDHHLQKQCHAVLFSPVFSVLSPSELVKWMIDDHVPARLNMQMHRYIWDSSARGV